MEKNYQLLDGFSIPKIGFGTYKLNGFEGTRRIEQALSVGYRLIDTAFNYENEGIVGQAIRNSSVPRDQLTITSKLPGRHHQYKEALTSIEESLTRLGLDYLDLYLIHWPNPLENHYVEAWQALIDAKKWGLVRSIGVCNFLPEHLQRLETETGVLPVINQIELHPSFNQLEQREYHQEKGIITEAWSPLGRGGTIFSQPILQEIAKHHQKTVAQVVLRWELQLGVLPIPKASHIKRQQENLAVFDFSLTGEEMVQINQLSQQNGRINKQDPAVYQEF